MWALLAAGGSFAATLLSGYIQSSAASKAAAAQLAANKQATAEAQRQFNAQMKMYEGDKAAALARYNTLQSELSPYKAAGLEALKAQMALMGIGQKELLTSDAQAQYAKDIAAAEEAKKTFADKFDPKNAVDLVPNVSDSKKDKTIADTYTPSSTISELYNGGPTAPTATDPRLNIKDNADNKSGANITNPEEVIAEDSKAAYDKAVAEAVAKRDLALAEAEKAQTGEEAQRQAIAAIEANPEMAALTSKGEEAILMNASATGGLRGGNTQSAIAQFRPSVLASLINQQYQRLGAMTEIGQSSILGAAGAGGGSGVGYPDASSIINLLNQKGSITSGNALAQGNAYSSIPNAFMAGLGAFAGFGGFGSSTSQKQDSSAMPWGNWNIKF